MNKQNDAEKQTKQSTPVSAAKGTKRLSTGTGDMKKIVLTVICAVIVLVLCIGVGIQQLKPKVVLKVNDTKFTMDDMMYPIYERESQYLPYNEMYQYYTGQSVWDNTYNGSDRNVQSGTSNAIGLKQEIIDMETEYEVLYQEAKKAGEKLSDADKKEVKEEVAKALKGLSFTQKLQLNISKSSLTKRFEKRKLANNYKDAQVAELDKTVDEKAAVKDISKTDYRQYKVQYYAFTGTKKDSDGNSTKRTAKEKEELKAKIEKIAKEAKTAKDFTKLVDDKEKDITYSTGDFTEKDGWSLITDKKLLKQIKAMKKNEISGVIEDKKTGYTMVVKMIDNNSSDSYDDACKSAIENAQNSAYDTWYQGIMKNYKVKTYSKVWDDVTIGTVTTDIVTADDLTKMKDDSSEATSGN